MQTMFTFKFLTRSLIVRIVVTQFKLEMIKLVRKLLILKKEKYKALVTSGINTYCGEEVKSERQRGGRERIEQDSRLLSASCYGTSVGCLF